MAHIFLRLSFSQLVTRLGIADILADAVIKQATLRTHWQRHPEAEQPLRAWYNAVGRSRWRSMLDVLGTFPKASPLNADRVRFPILGGNYRLIAAMHFPSQVVWIKFIGTHTEYDRIDALTVDQF